MAKSTKAAHGGSNGGSNGAAHGKPGGKAGRKTRSATNGAKGHPATKSRAPARAQADDSHGNWATDLVFDVREPKLAVSLRLDADVLRFFRGFGSGYQTRINEVLKAFMHARTEAENDAHALPAARMVRAAHAGHAGKRAR